jgi:tRNA (cytidine/uridine-2'-O-)-methyltransferase
MFHLVLFQPEIPPNTGNAIRLCANTGSTLHLVKPLGFDLYHREARRAGLDYDDLATIKLHVNWEACLEALQGARLFTVETSGTRLYTEAGFQPGDALVFGSERRGLPPKVLDAIAPERQLIIPMRANNRSLNLSNAAALVVYEAWRQNGFMGAGEPPSDTTPPP